MAKVNLQDAFLYSLRTNKIPVTIYLMNGVKVEGIITGYDQYTIIITGKGKQSIIFKHAVSTIIPQKKLPELKKNKTAADSKKADKN